MFPFAKSFGEWLIEEDISSGSGWEEPLLALILISKKITFLRFTWRAWKNESFVHLSEITFSRFVLFQRFRIKFKDPFFHDLKDRRFNTIF